MKNNLKQPNLGWVPSPDTEQAPGRHHSGLYVDKVRPLQFSLSSQKMRPVSLSERLSLSACLPNNPKCDHFTGDDADTAGCH